MMPDIASVTGEFRRVAQQSGADVYPWGRWAQVAPRWGRLVAASDIRSFFLTADWVGTWLEIFGDQLDPEIVFFRDGTGDFAACVLVNRGERRGPLFVRRLYLNTTGEDEPDETFLERNSILCAAGRDQDAADALVQYVAGEPWDELVLNGCLRTASLEGVARRFAAASQTRTTRTNFYVDLAALRNDGKAYEHLLSAKTRYNIRQSLKLYEQTGPVKVRRASDEGDAQQLLTRLAEFHQTRWETRNMPGAFGSPKFMAFHRALISRVFSKGAIELIEVTAGNTPIGLLYNFVLGSVVSFYQCGFNYSENKRLRPGLVALFAAINDYLARGFDEFDLMEGDVEYKRSLSTSARELDWIVIERPTWKQKVLSGLSMLKNRYESRREAYEGARQ